MTLWIGEKEKTSNKQVGSTNKLEKMNINFCKKFHQPLREANWATTEY